MFSDKLKNYRNTLGLTQEEFAERVNISRGVISQLEANLRPPSKAVLKKIAAVSGNSIEWWFSDDDAEFRYADLNALNLLLDFLIEKGEIRIDGSMDDETRDYINEMVATEIRMKIDKKYGKK